MNFKLPKLRGYCCVGLDNPKTPINVGHVLRAVGCFDVAMLAVSGQRYKRSSPDTQKTYRHTPLLEVDDLKTIIPYDCVPVAVDLVEGARSLVDYTHPERAIYIFGAEDAILGERVLSYCRDKIYIPSNFCLNLAMATNIVLYDRIAKQMRK
jgi:tRNA(Leu) C34 or U34 (ribose-2'-O)-methylase TrmL